MGRLIDAEKLKEKILRECVIKIVRAIDEQPTAYYVDKVVEELDDYLFEKYCIECDKHIFDIVEGGGTDTN